jgi:biotin operon repressor
VYRNQRVMQLLALLCDERRARSAFITKRLGISRSTLKRWMSDLKDSYGIEVRWNGTLYVVVNWGIINRDAFFKRYRISRPR